MEKHLTDALRSQAGALGVELEEEAGKHLLKLLEMLLVWNKKVNLTAIVDPLEAVEGHLVDSLAAVPEVRGAAQVLDLGAGGGFPSLPLSIVLPGTRFVLVDAVGKKVGFLKAAIAALGLANAQALHVRAQGDPQKEKIPVGDVAICRAFLPLPQWLELGARYVEPGGRVLAMLGPDARIPAELPHGLTQQAERRYRLPASGAERRIATFSKP